MSSIGHRRKSTSVGFDCLPPLDSERCMVASDFGTGYKGGTFPTWQVGEDSQGGDTQSLKNVRGLARHGLGGMTDGESRMGKQMWKSSMFQPVGGR